MHYRAFENTLELDKLFEDLIFEGTSHVSARATFTRECLASASHSTFELLVSSTVCSIHVLLAAANHIAYYVPLMFDSSHGYW